VRDTVLVMVRRRRGRRRATAAERLRKVHLEQPHALQIRGRCGHACEPAIGVIRLPDRIGHDVDHLVVEWRDAGDEFVRARPVQVRAVPKQPAVTIPDRQ
jgi:hypothetical protein